MMQSFTTRGLSAAGLVALGLMASVGPALTAELKFEHVMNIGTAGTGEGQFKYVEDFAFSKEGHLLATDAAHAYVQAFDKTTGKFIARFGGKATRTSIWTSRKASRSIPTATSSSRTTTPASSRSTTRATSGS